MNVLPLEKRYQLSITKIEILMLIEETVGSWKIWSWNLVSLHKQLEERDHVFYFYKFFFPKNSGNFLIFFKIGVSLLKLRELRTRMYNT